MSLRHITCDICGSSDYRVVNTCHVTASDADVDERVLTMVKCRTCGLVFLNPQPVLSKDQTERLYSKEYFDNLYRMPCGGEECGPTGPSEDFSYRLALISKFKEAGRILDIGCATGEFLEEARRRGWEVTGVEPSAHAAGIARTRSGSDVFTGTLENAHFPDGHFDVVACGDVLEHIYSPSAFLKEARRVLKEDGIIYIAVPNFGSLHYGLMSVIAKFNHKNYFLLPHHLYHFTKKTLRALAEKAGFSVEKIVDSQSRYNWKGWKAALIRMIYFIGKLFGAPDRMIMIARKR